MATSVLLVEDDEFKEELISEYVRAEIPHCVITSARSVSDGVKYLQENKYDLILLDISLPSFEIKLGGAQPLSQPTGGVELLLELSFHTRNDRVVIITQFPDIEYENKTIPLKNAQKFFNKELGVNITKVIYFNAQTLAWKKKLGDALH